METGFSDRRLPTRHSYQPRQCTIHLVNTWRIARLSSVPCTLRIVTDPRVERADDTRSPLSDERLGTYVDVADENTVAIGVEKRFAFWIASQDDRLASGGAWQGRKDGC